MGDSTAALDMHNEQTYNLHFKKLYKPLCFFAMKILNDMDRAEDIVQDCFLKLWLHKKSFIQFESLQSYLYLSVKNACFDELAHHKVQAKYLNHLDKDPITDQNILDLIVHAEVLRKTLEAMHTLPQKCQQVMHLAFNEGLSTKEIADELGVTISTVTNQKLRGLALLKKQLCQPEIVILLNVLTFEKYFSS